MNELKQWNSLVDQLPEIASETLINCLTEKASLLALIKAHIDPMNPIDRDVEKKSLKELLTQLLKVKKSTGNQTLSSLYELVDSLPINEVYIKLLEDKQP